VRLREAKKAEKKASEAAAAAAAEEEDDERKKHLTTRRPLRRRRSFGSVLGFVLVVIKVKPFAFFQSEGVVRPPGASQAFPRRG